MPAWLRAVLGWSGVVGIAASVLLVGPDSPVPGPWSLTAVLASALVIVSGIGTESASLWILRNPVANYLGDISYSLYLWHLPVIVIGFAIIGEGVWQALALLVVTAILSVHGYHLVEDPIRRSGWLTAARGRRRRSRRRGTGSGSRKYFLLSLVTTITVALVLIAVVARPAHTREQAMLIPVAEATADPGLPPAVQSLQAEIRSALGATAYPELSPTIDSVMAGRDGVDPVADCGLASHWTEPACTFGDSAAQHQAILVGNSIGLGYGGTLRKIVMTQSGWQLTTYAMAACQWTDWSVDDPSQESADCLDRVRRSLDAINAEAPDVVFIAGVKSARGLESELAKITSHPRIVLLPQAPYEKDPSECYTKLSVPADCIGGIPSDWASVERNVAAQTGATFVDTSTWFCYATRCPEFVGTIPVKRDRIHISPAYSEFIADAALATFQAAGVLE